MIKRLPKKCLCFGLPGCGGDAVAWWWNPYDDSVQGACAEHEKLVNSTPFGQVMWTRVHNLKELAIARIQNS
jgi:hypothetical protein